MLPTEDAAWVGEELGRRFGLPLWSFALTATDANRWALRLCRAITKRPYVLVFNYCYHGSVDESFVTIDQGGAARAPATSARAIDPTITTRVASSTTSRRSSALLADGEVACVLTEPALTNIGIVLPEPGFLAGLRAACDRTGTLLIIDETHTLSAGPGGCTKAWGLEPDLVTLGKSIAGGVPIGAYGVSAEVGARIEGLRDADLIDVGGVGGTLAGNPLSLAAARATLADVLTADAFDAHDAPVRPLRRGRRGRHRRARAAVVDRPARRAGRAGLRPRAAAYGWRERRPRTTPSSRTSCTSSCSTAASSSRRSTTWRSCRRPPPTPTSTATPTHLGRP